jgi:hypothetical protein
VPSGWTLIRRTNESDRIAMATYVYVATGTDPGSFTWGWSVSRRASIAVRAYRAVDTASPIAAHSGAFGDSVGMSAPSVTAVDPNSQLLALFTTREITVFTDTNAPLMTEAWRLLNPGGDVSAFGLHAVIAAPGATGARTADNSADGEWAAQLVLLNPRF